MVRWTRGAALAALALMTSVGAAGTAGAQTPDAGGTNPAVSEGLWVPARTSLAPTLRRTIALELDSVTVRRALAEVAKRTGLSIGFGEEVTASKARVSVRGVAVTVRDALATILRGTGLEAYVSLTTNRIVIRPAPRNDALDEIGGVAGRVTDAKTGDAVAGAEVWLENTRQRVATNDKGYYKLSDVPVGGYTLVVRRLGYAKQTRAIAVVADRDVTADVALQPVATQLDEIVTTVTGDQRARELGHVVGRINADSVVREAPVSNLSELLTARVAGFQVFQNQGSVGGVVKLQSRGPNSLLLNSEPIIVVDGVRYTSAYVKQAFRWPFGTGPARVEPTSPLNDLNPSDIETIEVVKGPSAATLYGTDAANGVVVVTTKRGRPGPARWSTYAKVLSTAVPSQHFAETYYPWGHSVPDGAPRRCSLAAVASGACLQDSVTVIPNPLNDPEWTLLASQPAWNFGASVSGGRQEFKYYFAGDVEQATGPLRMPAALEKQLVQQRGIAELPEEQRKPNALHQFSLRANVAADLGRAGDVRVNTAYSRGATRSLAAGLNPYSIGAIFSSPTDPYQGAEGFSPANIFSSTSTERTDRFAGSANSQWRPTSWLQARATIGLDLTSRNRYSFTPPGTDLRSYDAGAVGDERLRQLAMTADLGATAMARRGRLTLRTSIGAQYLRSVDDQLQSFGYDLPPGGTSVGEASSVFTNQTYQETVTLGSYLEETLGFNDRLFLTGAVRVDGASTFGQDYAAAAYPKVSLSWIVSEEPFMPRIPGLDELRIRYAYGASGQQPKPAWAGLSYNVTRALVDGAVRPIVSVASLGNPDLKPERVREHEVGFDAAALQNRVRLGLTWYKRKTSDQIVSLPLGPGLGGSYTNIGLTSQHGFEAELTANVLTARTVSFDVTVRHGLHRTKLEDLGGGSTYQGPLGGWVEGYPIGARFQRPVVGYDDANGDGIIVGDEVQYGTQSVYLGEGTPPIAQALTSVIGFFDRRVRLSALFERRTGFVQFDGLETNRCFNAAACRALVDPSTPLSEQAVARAAYDRSYFVPQRGDYTRLREVAIAVELPSSVTQRLRLRSATVSLAGRNLALWTKFSGPDPESAALGGQTTADEGNVVSAGLADGVPMSRSWSLRVDLGL